ncbi:hypothetical protein ACIP6Q_12165 [Streptomyces bobili]|uniref:hypothetical protein n=1 Tax=Streptomyces bobili TaxID=67280 RepID=UPI0038145A75
MLSANSVKPSNWQIQARDTPEKLQIAGLYLPISIRERIRQQRLRPVRVLVTRRTP